MTSCQKNQNRIVEINFADIGGKGENPLQIMGAVTYNNEKLAQSIKF